MVEVADAKAVTWVAVAMVVATMAAAAEAERAGVLEEVAMAAEMAGAAKAEAEVVVMEEAEVTVSAGTGAWRSERSDHTCSGKQVQDQPERAKRMLM